MAEQKFDISIDRVEKIPVPLLVIGLGGTGCDALKAVKRTFAERYVLPVNADGQTQAAPPKTAYLGFDSLNQRPDGLEINEYVDISIAGMDKILANQDTLLLPYERSWVNRDLRHEAAGLGMGTVRQAARLALCRNYDKVTNALRGALTNIVSVAAGAPGSPVNRIEIVILTGISGGTGSGTFLDMAQIVRYVGSQVSQLPVQITGYIVMPDVSLSRVKSASGMEDPIKHNAYAALKELDFWMRVKEHEVPYTMQYNATTSITWSEKPFDSCLLMSSTNTKGLPYKDGYEAVMNTIAENLMHYMAHEDGVTTQYSYRQYEDNLGAIRISKRYPAFYGYRAIGAFTKRIPKKALLYYEGKCLLSTFIPLRDSKGMMQPDRRMFTDGQGSERADKIIGRGGQMMQDFRTRICRLPACCFIDLSDKIKVSEVQNMNPPAHSRWHNKRNTDCAPAALEASEKYLNEAWNRFVQFANAVITDPEQGPFALRLYLDDVSGLLSEMNNILATWTNQRNKFRKEINDWEETCKNSFGNFCHPPLLGRKNALETYDHALRSLYTAVWNSEFMEHYVPALEKLILRVKEYLADGLKPMCATIEKLEEEFNTTESTDTALVQDIYQLEEVKDKIDEVFADANANNRLAVSFLQEVTTISMLNAPNVDSKSSGVTFLCRSAGLEKLCTMMQEKLTETYGDVNNQSLDAIMVSNVGEDIAKQQQWMNRLATEVLDSAVPMFMQSEVFQNDEKAPYSYMSIPYNAKKHIEYISEAFKTHDPHVEPKESSLTDHIYCLNTWDKLPLYRYGKMEELRITYDADLNKEGAPKGMHLVCNGDPNASFQTDWSKFPSPKPYFLYPGNGTHSEQDQYKQVKNLVRRGMACGMLEVSTEETTVSVKVHLQYAPGTKAFKTSETMRQDRAVIAAEKNPATGMPYTKAEIGEKLAAYLASGKTVYLEEKDVRPSQLASVLGLANEPCDPFDIAVQADITALAKAKENHAKLCVAMAEAIIYRRPDITHALEIQVPAVEEIRKEVGLALKSVEAWKNRTEFASTAADLFIFLNDVISLGGSGYRYKYKGEKYDMVNENLLADDLKDVSSDYVKTIAFLAEVPEHNSTKATLMRMLKDAKDVYDTAVDEETVTTEKMQDLIDAANDLKDEADEEAVALEHEMHSNPSEEDALKCQMELMQAFSKALERNVRSFKKIQKGL